MGSTPTSPTILSKTAKHVFVNDIHSQLNKTKIHKIRKPRSTNEVISVIHEARDSRKNISISGGRHAMGGQQFGTETILIDMRDFNDVLSLDKENGLITVEGGAKWPKIINYLAREQKSETDAWALIQKQTGASRLSIGGALASNIHGRGLKLKPIINDVEKFTIVDANGATHVCNRSKNKELFELVIGGYGLFGIVTSVTLRLKKRENLRRVVEIIELKDLMTRFKERINDGFLYGDFQFITNEKDKSFLKRGIFSCYKPTREFSSKGNKWLTPIDWVHLYYLSHADKAKAYKKYSDHYLSTSGQVYDPDRHQFGYYMNYYHRLLDLTFGEKGTEMITEIYVPRNRLEDFMIEVADDFRRNNVNLIYGTVRLIEKDDESFLPWARESFACVIFNLHVTHTKEGIERSKGTFRRLIDYGINRGGGFFLTYHRWATRKQIEKCYPQFKEFLELKKKYDPSELFQSDWYRHHKELFCNKL